METKYPIIKHDIGAYYIHADKVARLKGKSVLPVHMSFSELKTLPAIVRKSIWVKFADSFFPLRSEGLYRFWDWGKVKYDSVDTVPQVIGKRKSYSSIIVFKNDFVKLFSSLSHLHVHGIIHQESSFNEQMQAIKKGMLSLTCGPVSHFVVKLLSTLSIKARIVSLIKTESTYNSYDNGHVLFEFYWSKYKKWVLVDIDSHVMFTENGRFLNAYEITEIVRRGGAFDFYELAPLASNSFDCTHSISGIFDSAGLVGVLNSDISFRNKWFYELFKMPFLLDTAQKAWLFYTVDEKIAQKVLLNKQYSKRVSKLDWLNIFYR